MIPKFILVYVINGRFEKSSQYTGFSLSWSKKKVVRFKKNNNSLSDEEALRKHGDLAFVESAIYYIN